MKFMFAETIDYAAAPFLDQSVRKRFRHDVAGCARALEPSGLEFEPGYGEAREVKLPLQSFPSLLNSG